MGHQHGGRALFPAGIQIDRLGERPARVGVARQVKTDVAVTGLHEGETVLPRFGSGSFADQAKRSRHTAA